MRQIWRNCRNNFFFNFYLEEHTVSSSLALEVCPEFDASQFASALRQARPVFSSGLLQLSSSLRTRRLSESLQIIGYAKFESEWYAKRERGELVACVSFLFYCFSDFYVQLQIVRIVRKCFGYTGPANRRASVPSLFWPPERLFWLSSGSLLSL